MQIYALNPDDSLIFAKHAVKHVDYKCIECKETVRLRSGSHRQAHFYHSRPNGACRLHAKGLPHLMLQYHLKDVLPEGDVDLECRFETISRVADVAWHSRKIIFEIQCSPISPEEILERNHSYAKAGYQVIWILHDARYNRYRLSAAEHALADQPHYYSNMNSEGEGIIYDQLAIIKHGRRHIRFDPMPVDPALPVKYSILSEKKQFHKSLPPPLRLRTTGWAIALAGDTIFRFMEYMNSPSQNDLRLSEQFDHLRNMYRVSLKTQLINSVKTVYMNFLAIPYRSVFKLILERACR